MSVGLITHIDNPSLADVTALARAAESAGADWLGLPDAFWWRDTWILAAEAARVTQRLAVGPVVTNPYTRHPFVTLAAIATLQDLAGPRVILGVGAGGVDDPGQPGELPLHLVGEPGQVTGLAEQADGIVGPGTEGGQLGQHLIPGDNVGRTHIRSISEGYDTMRRAGMRWAWPGLPGESQADGKSGSAAREAACAE